VQLTENVVVAVLPEGTLTVRDVPPLTVQFAATPEIATVWLPAAKFVNVMPVLLLIAIGWPGPPSTATVYPSGSRLEPVVLVVTVRLPGGVTQLTEKVVVAVPPEGTVTVCVLPPLTVQFEATLESTTL